MDNLKPTYHIPGSKYAHELDVRWRKRHALAGSALAMAEIASDYQYWHKLGADGAMAFSWYMRAADAGDAESCRIVSDAFRLGYLELHVLKEVETVERFPIGKNSEKATLYKQRAKSLAEKNRQPVNRVLFDAGAGWCRFSPDNKTSVHVSCAFTGDFPVQVLTAFCDRLKRNTPVTLFMDSEGVYDVFTEGDISSYESFLIHEDLGKAQGPTVRKVRCDIPALARQIVCDIESDYYGWATFNYGGGFAKKEQRLRRLVKSLKEAIADFESAEKGPIHG